MHKGPTERQNQLFKIQNQVKQCSKTSFLLVECLRFFPLFFLPSSLPEPVEYAAAASLPSIGNVDKEAVKDQMIELCTKLQKYHPDRIYNQDETGFLYHLIPNLSYL